MNENDLIKSYSEHFELKEEKVREAIKIAQKISKEWNKRLGKMSEEEYDIVEGMLIKHLTKL